MAEVMIRDFLDAGHSVHLIQSRRKRIAPDIPDSLVKRECLVCDIIDRKVVDKTNFIRRYIDDVAYAFKAMKRWIKVKDADVVYLQSNPTILYPMLLLKLFNRKPIVYSIYDVFPGHAYDIGVIKSKLLYNIFRIMQKPCYKMADAVTVLSEDMKQMVVSEGAAPEKVWVVPPWFDVKSVREVREEDNQFIKKYNIDTNKFYVQFAGTVGYVFNYKTVIELAERLKHIDNIVVQIIGDGNVKERFVKEAQDRGLDNIEFYPLQPVEIVPDVYSACNICIIPLMKGVIGNGVPSKAPILMACKRVIVNSVETNSRYAKMFSEYDMGVAVGIEDYDKLAEEVIRLYNSPEQVRKMAENAYNYGRKHYTSEEGTKKLMDIFELIGG